MNNTIFLSMISHYWEGKSINIEILSRTNMIDFSFHVHKERIAVISISDIDKGSPEVFNNPENGIIEQLQLHFDDVEIGKPNCITDEIAEKIAAYINRVRNNAGKVIVHCEAGISRSAGVGARIIKFLNDNDMFVFNNPRFRPNMTCYRKVLNALIDSSDDLAPELNI